MINVVIPMAGAGSRFVAAGYQKPKPLIDVRGRTMIDRVLENLKLENARFILIVREEHLRREPEAFQHLCQKYAAELITVDKLTEGAACTVLLATTLINNEQPLLMANSDQIVEMAVADFIADSEKRNLDGSMVTFFADHPKWSYAKVDERGYLIELREKVVISNQATAGFYYYRQGRDFVNSAALMIANNDRVNNEFYTAPAYNYALKSGKKIGIYEIQESQMFGLGTPEDLERYIQHIISK